MISGLSPHILAPRVAAIRAKAAELGRKPEDIKIFAIVTPILGRTEEEAQAKYKKALEHASYEAGLAFYSGNAGIDLSTYRNGKPLPGCEAGYFKGKAPDAGADEK